MPGVGLIRKTGCLLLVSAACVFALQCRTSDQELSAREKQKLFARDKRIKNLKGEPTPRQVHKWLAAIDETQDLWVDYGRPKPGSRFFWRRDRHRRDMRYAALQSLAKSETGIRALIEYWERESSDQVAPHLVEVANTIGTAVFQRYANGSDFLTTEELRALLLSSERSPVSVGIPSVASALPLEKLIALSDVWMSWLRHVNPGHLEDSVKEEDGHIVFHASLDAVFFRTSCEVLRASYNPEGIPLVLDILRKMPKDNPRIGRQGYRSEAIIYLFAMGASDAFEELLGFVEPAPCNGGESRLLLLADEPHALTYFSSCGPPEHFFYQPGRPDLCRGLAPSLLHDPKMRQTWELSANARPAPDPRRLDVFRMAAPALSAETILKEALIAEKRGTADVPALWIELLERKDSETGTEEMIRWASLKRNGPFDMNPVRVQAGRALLRRLLAPNGERVAKRLASMDEKERADLAEEILRDSGFISGLARNMGVECGTLVQVCYSKTPPSSYANTQAFLLAHEEKLMRLIQWIRDPDRLCGTFALMKGEEARRWFLDLLGHGNAQAVSLAWTFDLDVPLERLRQTLRLPGLSLENQMFLKLKMSEQGDNEAYRLLKAELLQNLNRKGAPSAMFRGPILNEMVRRRDVAALEQAIESVKEGVNDVAFFWPLCASRKGSLIALLMQVDANAALGYFRNLDFSNEHVLQDALQVVVSSSSPNAEPLLKKMTFLTKRWVEASPAVKEKDATLAAWPMALFKTATPWCRDQLYEMKQWDLLAELGDSRGAEGEPRAYGWPCNHDAAWDAFASGNIKKAVDLVTPKDNPSRAYRCEPFTPVFVRPQGGGLVGLKSFPEGRLKAVMDDFTRLFPALSPQQKVASFRLLGSEREYWPDALVREMLKDPYAPVRLSVLLYLLEHPAQGFEADIENVQQADTYPWCRRIAHEILIFEPDPLAPEKGIRFEIPGAY